MMCQVRVTKERDDKMGRKKEKGLRPRSGEAEIDIRWNRGGVVSKELPSVLIIFRNQRSDQDARQTLFDARVAQVGSSAASNGE
jgi:hypothetical protein